MNGAKGNIIIKKKKHAAHDEHGGAWKIAYADFVTAMMAFFLLMWLLNSVAVEKLQGIADYFAPVSTRINESGGGGLLAGQVAADDGVMTSMQESAAPMYELPKRNGEVENNEDEEEPIRGPKPVDEGELARMIAEREAKQFRNIEQQLRAAIADNPQLQGLAKSLIIENVPEGLRIQILDQEGVAMFPRGSADMQPYTARLIELVAQAIGRLPQKLEITGHTDATPFLSSNGYSNWELSSDRANAARRVLIENGVPEERFSRVVGRAATEPFIRGDPMAAGNRRLSLILLRGTGQKS